MIHRTPDSAQLPLAPLSAFAGLSLPTTTGRGVIIAARDELEIATVLARKGQQAALAKRFQERLQIKLPHGPRRTSCDDLPETLALIGTGPGAWLATREPRSTHRRDTTEHTALVSLLAAMIGDLACISEQSDGYAVLRLSGPKLRDALRKVVSVDLHPSAFAVGQAASTGAAHIGALLWRLEDSADANPVFEIAIYRSYAASFWHALAESAAEYGIVRVDYP